MMTTLQRKLVKTIRDLHRRGEPLNITTVKRGHPELMAAVYAVKPFWGWHTAIKDAGINYAKIKVELQETLACELCGKSVRNLANHVILKHGVSADEYLMDYPGSELQSETLRAGKTIGKNRFLGHWEPVWSREYILDRIAEYHRRGYPMHFGKFTNIEAALILAAKRYWGGWNEALIAAGLDPRKLTQEAYRQLHNYPDKEAVIQGIKQRFKKGLGLNYSAVFNSKVSLLKSGIEYFGSWDNALTEAGIDPAAIHQALKPKRKYTTKQDVIREIRARYKRKWALNHADLYHGKNQDQSLVGCACEYFGSWDNALKAAGFDPVTIHKQALWRHLKFPDAKSVLNAIKQRAKEGRFMNYRDLAYGANRNTLLVEWASKFFGSWDNALKTAGFDPIKIHRQAILRRCRYPDKESVLKALKQRNKKGCFMNHGALVIGDDQNAPLLHRALEFFGSWDNALKAIGLDPTKIHRRIIVRQRRLPDKESVLKALKHRNKEGRPMRYGGLDSGPDRDRTLLNCAVKFFGSWNNALKAGGLAPSKIKLTAKEPPRH